MWSLPDIKVLNAEAKDKSKEREKAIETFEYNGEKLTCSCCGSTDVKFATLTFDVFSDDPKGIHAICEECEEKYGRLGEDWDNNLFECTDCERVFIDHYIWERYRHDTEDDETLCLNCHFDRELRKEENWVMDAAQICEASVHRAKHLIPVAGEHWKHRLVFLGNAVFDSSGHCISGSGVDELRELAREGIEEYGKVMLIMDGCFQFACSVSIYAPKPVKKNPEPKKRVKKTSAVKRPQMSRIPDMEGQVTMF